MPDPAGRLLRLLALLQARPQWSGADLADRLEVSPRSVRRDVERLRDLGYPLHATRGSAGYRLGSGATLPPLLLDDDEAVAVAVGLRAAASGVVGGIEESALRALAKIEQMLPSRVRYRVDTLQIVTVPVPAGAPKINASILTTIAAACREYAQLRFDYRDHAQSSSRRAVEPHRLVCWGRRWYLVAWDTDRDDWRTFRVDRMHLRSPNGPRFAPRDPPDGDVSATWRGSCPQRCGRTMPRRSCAPMEAVAARMWPGFGVLTPLDEHSCMLDVGADSLEALAQIISLVDVEFDVSDAAELVEIFERLAGRYARAISAQSRP